MHNNLIITSNTKIKAYGEHLGKEYIVNFENISSDLLYYSFPARWQMEEFLYRKGITKYIYKSSSGKEIIKVWEFKQKELEAYKRLYGTRLKPYPEDYSSQA